MATKMKLLVHACCAPCSAYVFEKLISEGFEPEGFFYNPNIYPEDEYKKRLLELTSFADLKKYKLQIYEESEEKWLKAVEGHEQEKEGGNRCEICFRLRLEKTAKFASQNNYDGFTTVLTVSPHKNSALINKIGKELENKHQIYFLEADFKKNDGFKKSLKISRDYGFYRQNYCGCKFSIRSS